MFTAFSDGLQPSPETRPKGQCGDTGFGFLLLATVPVDLLTSTVQETLHRLFSECLVAGTIVTWVLVSQTYGTTSRV